MAVFSHKRDLQRESEFEDLFGGSAMVPQAQATRSLSIDVLVPWTYEDGRPQPFHEYSPEDLESLADSIQQDGILNPPVVWRNPKLPGKYQIISGHNRISAAKLLGMDRINCAIKEVSYTEAERLLLESNLRQRKQILPSEYAVAYAREIERLMEAEKLGKTEAINLLAAHENLTLDNVYQYTRLNNLHPTLVQWTDAGSIPITVAGNLAALPSDYQTALVETMRQNNITAVSVKQGNLLRQAAKEWETAAEFQAACPDLLGLVKKQRAKKPEGYQFYVNPDLSGLKKSVAKRLKKDKAYQLGLAEAAQKAADEAARKFTEKYLETLRD